MNYIIMLLILCSLLCLLNIISPPNKYLNFLISTKFATTKDSYKLEDGNTGQLGLDVIDGKYYLKCKWLEHKYSVATYMYLDEDDLKEFKKSIKYDKYIQDNNTIVGSYLGYKITSNTLSYETDKVIDEVCNELEEKVGVKIERPNYLITCVR